MASRDAASGVTAPGVTELPARHAGVCVAARGVRHPEAGLLDRLSAARRRSSSFTDRHRQSSTVTCQSSVPSHPSFSPA